MSRLVVCGALALFLMVADTRLQLGKPVRMAVATALYPLQWALMQPIAALAQAGDYFTSLTQAQAQLQASNARLTQQALQAGQVDQLRLENTQLRQLLALRDRITVPGTAAQVLYEAADPYTRKVIIDRGLVHRVAAGSPVIDAFGVQGQVTRTFASTSEVTLVTDGDQAIPVLNTRTGLRGVAFGDAGAHAGALELRFMAANADVQEGDVLSTSGVDGVYPPGLPVARVTKVERRVDSVFARIYCEPLAQASGTLHVMVLAPVAAQIEPRPVEQVPAATLKKGAKK
jgi:rod shape-determining protein MreC